MAQGSKQKYTSKQKRKAHDIERDYKAWGQAAKKQNAADGRLQINHIVVVGKSGRRSRESEANQVPAKAGEKAAGNKSLMRANKSVELLLLE